MQRRLFIATGVRFAGVGGLTWSVSHPVFGASVLAVRVWPASEYTRLTIESDVPLRATVERHAKPPRVSIDLHDMTLSDVLRDVSGKIQSTDPFIAGLRVAQYKPTVVRMVVDLKQDAVARNFALPPVAAYRHRHVVDLVTAGEPDPLLALLREKKLLKPTSDDVTTTDPRGQVVGKQNDQASASMPSRTTSSRPQPYERVITIALDPGHGGEDPGAIGPKGLREKDVVLAVAEAWRDRINGEPNMRAYMTRTGDYYVPLKERVQRARKARADLFVSIHADAVEDGEASGASVFALSAKGASSTMARYLANKENASDAIGGVDLKSKHNLNTDVVRTILDMSTAAQIKDSLRLGTEVLGQLDRVGKLHKPHVEQAGFAVLKAPDIPSILVEVAFISNPEEEQKLKAPGYQQKLVEALHAGVKRYFAKHGGAQTARKG